MFSILMFMCVGLVQGFDWTITYGGKEFVNSHQDPDHVKTPCTQENSICAPITYSVLYCDLLNSAVDSDLEIRDILRKYSCGFFFNEPMVCCPFGEVTEEPSCDTDGDIKSRELLKSKATFYEFLNVKSEKECGIRTLDLNSIRIAGGKEATPGDWPWMALIGYARKGKTGTSFECGGTLINLKSVLTSAHCIDKREVTEIRLGETDLTTSLDCLDLDTNCPFTSEEECLRKSQCAEEHVVRKLARQIIHPRYNSANWDYDVGILTLDRAVTISHFIRPVCLPEVGGELDEDNLWIVTGWGTTSNMKVISNTLQQVQVDIRSRSDCSAVWGVEVLSSQVCAAGTEDGAAVCEGDSGGPLLTRSGGVWELGAVVSSGSSICGDTKPTFFTLINHQILEWIGDNLAGGLPRRPN